MNSAQSRPWWLPRWYDWPGPTIAAVAFAIYATPFAPRWIRAAGSVLFFIGVALHAYLGIKMHRRRKLLNHSAQVMTATD